VAHIVFEIVVALGYVWVSYVSVPKLSKFSLGEGPEADLARLATRGQTYGSFGTLKTTPALELVLILVMIPGYIIGAIIAQVAAAFGSGTADGSGAVKQGPPPPDE
jgi:hypothetical protein